MIMTPAVAVQVPPHAVDSGEAGGRSEQAVSGGDAPRAAAACAHGAPPGYTCAAPIARNCRCTLLALTAGRSRETNACVRPVCRPHDQAARHEKLSKWKLLNPRALAAIRALLSDQGMEAAWNTLRLPRYWCLH